MEAGQIQPIEHIPAHIKFFISTLSWWSVNAKLCFPDMDITNEEAKEILLGIIQRTYQAV